MPEDSKDMMDQIDYIQEAQTTIVNQLKESVEVSIMCVVWIYNTSVIHCIHTFVCIGFSEALVISCESVCLF